MEENFSADEKQAKTSNPSLHRYESRHGEDAGFIAYQRKVWR